MLLLAFAVRAELDAALPCLKGHPLAEHEPLVLPLPLAMGGQQTLVCLTGVGPVNAGTAMGRALALRPDIRAVCCVGLAGSYNLARAPLGSVWRVDQEVWPEYGLAPAGSGPDPTADAEALGFPLWESPGGTVWNRLDLPDAQIWQEAVHPLAASGYARSLPGAIALCVAGVSADAARADALGARHGALLENMEGFAVALPCARRSIPLLEARVVSNLAGSRAAEHRAFGLALHALGDLLCKLLAHEGGSHA